MWSRGPWSPAMWRPESAWLVIPRRLSAKGEGWTKSRTIPGDWFAGSIPVNVVLDETAYLETAYYFSQYRSEAGACMRIGRGASGYGGRLLQAVCVGPV